MTGEGSQNGVLGGGELTEGSLPESPGETTHGEAERLSELDGLCTS